MLLSACDEDTGEHMTDRQLRDEVMTILLAGHETTAGSLAWAVERLARAPRALARVRDGDAAWIDAVIKETLRVRPVLTVAPRKLAVPLDVHVGRGRNWHDAAH